MRTASGSSGITPTRAGIPCSGRTRATESQCQSHTPPGSCGQGSTRTMTATCEKSWKPVPYTAGETGGDNYVLSANAHIHLYVTGLTVALVAAINACHTLHLPLTLW